jgi:hypothetical protein
LRKIISFLLLLLSQFLFSQDTYIGGGITLPTYWGDFNGVSPINNVLNNTNFGISFAGARSFGSTLTGEASISIGKMQGADSLSKSASLESRNLSFSSRIVNAQLALKYHPFTLQVSDYQLLPFISAGGNVFLFDPTTNYKGLTYRLQPLGTEGQGMPGFADKYNLWSYGLSGGGGLIVQINERLRISLQSELVITFTDYLDDVSGSYVNFFELSAGNGTLSAILADRTSEYLGTDQPTIRPTGTQRGGRANDYFFLSSLRIFYSIGEGNVGNRSKGKIYCPKFD